MAPTSTEEQPRDRRHIPEALRRRPHQELIQRVLPVVQVPAANPVPLLQIRGRQEPPRDHRFPGAGGVPFMIYWEDAAEAFRLGLEIDLARLPSKCEVFFILADAPQDKFLNEKAKRILGFAPKVDVSVVWRKRP